LCRCLWPQEKDECLRPYHVENTPSHPICQVKQRWASLVLGLETAWESQVLSIAFCWISQNVMLKGVRARKTRLRSIVLQQSIDTATVTSDFYI
uniref:Ovule protein n=1 Tax=Anisakis simplex TaxID=6269 RepID=A0A0M3JVY5_ANISI